MLKEELVHLGGEEVYLDTVVSICKVIHWLELFVDDAHTGFVGTDGDFFNVFGGFALFFELSVNLLRSFYGSLRMEFSWGTLLAAVHVYTLAFHRPG